MKIKYLGTAAAEGWPGIFCDCPTCTYAREHLGKDIRSRSQAMVDDQILLDFPPDTYMHALKENISFSQIQTLLITHGHHDHFFPDDIAMRNDPYAHLKNDVKLTVYADEQLKAPLEKSLEGFFGKDYKKYVNISFQEVRHGETFATVEGYEVTPLEADHGGEHLVCNIYLISKDGKTLLYAHDTGWFPEKTWESLKGKKVDFLSIDGTSGKLDGFHSHLGIKQAGELVVKMKEMEILRDDSIVFANHFSHNGALNHEELEKLGKPWGLGIAYDGLSVEF